MKKSVLDIMEDTKKRLNEKKEIALSEGLNFHWETPNQKRAYLDAYTNISVVDYPVKNYVQSYADFLRSKFSPASEPVQEEVQDEESKKK